jgi:drug/metabolite transporter (DMT)-like permease
MYYIPILGALSLGAGTILQKTILRKRKIGIRLYQSAEFFAIVLAMLPFVYFFWKLDSPALQPMNIFVFSMVIIFSIAANLFTYYSMKWEKVSRLEPAKILEPLFTIILAIVFSFIFGEALFARNSRIIIPALIAASALIFSHVKKHHLTFNKYFIAAIAGSFFFALELVTSKLILDFYSPITFYFLIFFSIFLISLIAFRPKLNEIDNKLKFKILILGALWVIYRIVIYYGYLTLGVVFTTLLIMLGPVFVYLFAWKFLKEKLEWKNILAAAIIIGCILYAILE